MRSAATDEGGLVRIYVESSAILAWLLGESGGGPVVQALRQVSAIYSSDLLLVEVDRGISRAIQDGRINEAQAADARLLLNRSVSAWTMLSITADVVERARRPFPREPVRALDAIHLASLLVVSQAVGPARLLSLDERLRRSARELGFEAVPALGDTIHEGAGSVVDK